MAEIDVVVNVKDNLDVIVEIARMAQDIDRYYRSTPGAIVFTVIQDSENAKVDTVVNSLHYPDFEGLLHRLANLSSDPNGGSWFIYLESWEVWKSRSEK